MRSFGLKLTIFLVILGAGIASTARALGHQDRAMETVYVMPSSYTVPVPTSYVISTGWVEPTAYAVPTYYTSAYWMDPVVLAQPTYVSTAYVRRGLFGRRWVEERPVLTSYTTAYVPSAYSVAPTVRATSYVVRDPLLVPTAYVTSSDCICPTTVASAAPTYQAPATQAPSTARTAPRSRSVESQVDDLSAIDSSVPPAGAGEGSAGAGAGARQTIPGNLPPEPAETTTPNPDNTPPAPRPAVPSGGNPATRTAPRNPQTPPNTNPAAGGAATPRVNTNTNLGAAAPKTSTATPGAAARNPNTNNPVPPPTAPGGLDANGLQNMDEPPPLPGRHEVQRPAYYNAQPVVRTRYPNILIGTVLSIDREPEEGVRVSVRNATGALKATSTDAFGRFAVRLGDGDWSVDVTMPSGTVYEVSRLRVVDGVVTDRLGRRVPSLEITR